MIGLEGFGPPAGKGRNGYFGRFTMRRYFWNGACDFIYIDGI